MFVLQCNSCGKIGFTAGGPGQWDEALDCDCCPEKHNHGDNANRTGTPCRPITITAMPGTAPLQMAVGN